MKPEETAKIKKAVEYVLLARRSGDHVTSNMLLGSDAFFREFIEPLQEISGWNEEDERRMETLIRQFAEETKGHTLTEKSEKITRILAIGGGIAAAIAVAGGIALVAHQKGGKKKRNAED